MSKPDLGLLVPLAAESGQDGDAVIVGSADPPAPASDNCKHAGPSDVRDAFIRGVALGLAIALVIWALSRAGTPSRWEQYDLFRKYFKLHHDVKEYSTMVGSTCRVELLSVPGWNVDVQTKWIKAAVAVK